jgi:hypothetical protein
MAADTLSVGTFSLEMPYFNGYAGGPLLEIATQFGFLKDADLNSSDANNWLWTLYLLNAIYVMLAYPPDPPALQNFNVQGSGVIRVGTTVAGASFSLVGAVPSATNRWFGSPDIYKLGEIAKVYNSSGNPFMGPLEFLNFRDNYRQTLPGESVFGYYYNLPPGVRMAVTFYAIEAVVLQSQFAGTPRLPLGGVINPAFQQSPFFA